MLLGAAQGGCLTGASVHGHRNATIHAYRRSAQIGFGPGRQLRCDLFLRHRRQPIVDAEGDVPSPGVGRQRDASRHRVRPVSGIGDAAHRELALADVQAIACLAGRRVGNRLEREQLAREPDRLWAAPALNRRASTQLLEEPAVCLLPAYRAIAQHL